MTAGYQAWARDIRNVAEYLRKLMPPIIREQDTSVVYSVCGEEYCGDFLDSLRTLAAQQVLDRTHLPDWQPVHVVAVLDAGCKQRLSGEADLESMRQALSITAVSLGDFELMRKGPSEEGPFRTCAAVKLAAPLFLPGAHAVILDADTVVAQSLMPLFDLMAAEMTKTLFMAEEVVSEHCGTCGSYHARNRTRYMAGKTGYNTGTLGINLLPWKSGRVDDRVENVLSQVAVGNVQAWLGDQDVFNLMAKQDPSLAHTLPCTFNERSDSLCYHGRDYPTPAVLHGNRRMFNSSAIWSRARAALASAARRVLSAGEGHVRSMTSTEPGDPAGLWGLTRLNVKILFRHSAHPG